jgi:hypothetical protein
MRMRVGLLAVAHQEALAELSPAAIAEDGFSSLFMTCSEVDWPQSGDQMARVCSESHAVGLQVHLVPCGFGGFLRTIPSVPSPLLDAQPEFRQVDVRQRHLRCACPNHPEFLAAFAQVMGEMARRVRPDGFVWFQPSFEGGEAGWACRCRICQSMYASRHDEPMPTTFSARVAEFRQRSVVTFLLGAASAVKRELPRVRCAVVPTPSMSRQLVRTGNENWDRLLECSGVDGLGFVADWKHLGVDVISVFDKPVRGALRKARRYGKDCQVWINDIPAARDEVRQAFRLAGSLGVRQLVVCDHTSVQQPEVQPFPRRFPRLFRHTAKPLLARTPVY